MAIPERAPAERQPTVWSRVCPHCGQAIVSEGAACTHCGQAQSLPAPVIVLPHVRMRTRSRIEPAWHFASLFLVTLGLYQGVWVYRAWRDVKASTGASFSVFWKTVLFPLYIFDLAGRACTMAEERGAHGHSSTRTGIGYWVATFFAGAIPGTFGLLSLFGGCFLWRIQQDLNCYWESKERLRLKPRRFFSIGEMIAMTMCGAVWALLLISIL